MAITVPALPGEFRDGWKIILGCALGIASGVSVLYLSFSIFVVPLTGELQITRGELSNVQALILLSMIGSPAVGWLTDLYGVKRVYCVSALLVAATFLGAAFLASNLLHLGLTIAAMGLIGAGTGTVVLSRPINAHFRERRGTALGLMAMLISVMAIMAPPLIGWVMELWGWRGAFAGMGGPALLAGIPAVLLLMVLLPHRNEAPRT